MESNHHYHSEVPSLRKKLSATYDRSARAWYSYKQKTLPVHSLITRRRCDGKAEVAVEMSLIREGWQLDRWLHDEVGTDSHKTPDDWAAFGAELQRRMLGWSNKSHPISCSFFMANANGEKIAELFKVTLATGSVDATDFIIFGT